ncbi:hypothetical protein BV25DRAFT_1012538 [Artomyces pyxidatus]|uniref:Uncharacterized protein n=1 Tax=Artomyces pyxidatus TaxID=48021 RepID=A0ACB8SVJ5_9AGAM|nr:hypothetical protein BV25DRAFT_1012538 [Artomyces pyxidatus]
MKTPSSTSPPSRLCIACHSPHSLHHRTLCHALNVARPAPMRAGQLTRTYDLAVLHTTHPAALPTHVLAVFDTKLTDHYAPVTLIPVDLEHLTSRIRADVRAPAGRLLPAPPRARTLTLPVLPLQVPHAPSTPLLLLFALGLRADPSALAARLLPLAAVEEFPSAAAMAHAMAAHCDQERLGDYLAYNQGVWKNVLFLGVRDARVMRVVQTVWNVTAEARKLWLKEKEKERRVR